LTQRDGKILAANRPGKMLKRRRADRGEAHGGRGQIRATVIHGRTDYTPVEKPLMNNRPALRSGHRNSDPAYWRSAGVPCTVAVS
jgi:hypothetical protein